VKILIGHEEGVKDPGKYGKKSRDGG